MNHHAGGEQADVTDPVGGKGPQRRLKGVGALVEEADQHRRGDAEKLPSREQNIDAAGEHHEVHPGAEQREEDEEPGETRLAVEVFPGKRIDQSAQPGGEADVGHRQPVSNEIDRGVVVPNRKPGAEVDLLGSEAAHREHRQGDKPREEGEREGAADEPGGGPLREGSIEQRRQADEDEGQGRGSELEDDQQRNEGMGRGGLGLERPQQLGDRYGRPGKRHVPWLPLMLRRPESFRRGSPPRTSVVCHDSADRMSKPMPPRSGAGSERLFW